ncbi:tetratricopeptide repeat protein, partial [Pseudogemmobacter sonorensis]|uniref:tetratricopeptide repeat protein n=1 Tax=Pseudogemmobacter sonorensis TaxID=2989681 RepID=UPI003685A6C9
AAPTRAGGALLLPAALVVLAAGAALWTYQRMGAPGYVDMPLAERLAAADARMRDRPAQAEVVATLTPASPPEGVTADFLDLMAQMRAAVDPAVSTDLRGLDLLARNEAALGNFADAEAAQRRLIAVKGDQALAEDHSALADILVRAAAGYVSPEAEAALAAALALDPQEGVARYYLGLMFAQGGRYDRAFAVWRALLERGPQDAPWVPFLRAQIAEVAALAGVVYEVPAPRPPPSGGLRAPSAEEIEAAADLDEEDRMAMVEGMVSQLGARLASDGGSAAEWAQLIGALGVLGRRAEAAAILEEAREIFAALPGDLALIEAAARDAGVAE